MNRFNLDDRFDRVLNRLAKWRTVFASWQLGTRLTFGDGELAAVKDHHEATLLERVELDTLIGLLRDAQVIEPQTVHLVEGNGQADPKTTAVKEHRAETLRIRVELNALTQLLLARGTFTLEQWKLQCIEEAEHKEQGLERMFPGAKASDDGMYLHLPEWAETVRKYGFPP
jgi:hypothetical protein